LTGAVAQHVEVVNQADQTFLVGSCSARPLSMSARLVGYAADLEACLFEGGLGSRLVLDELPRTPIRICPPA
jgi:hypothetical protein